MKLIGNGKLLTYWDELPYIEYGAVAVNGDSVVEVGGFAELKEKYPDAAFTDAKEGVIMPGLINSHTHISRALLRGSRLACGQTTSFETSRAINAFERKLDLTACLNSAYAVLIESVKNGVTTLIDMHSSYLDPRGTLTVLAGAAEHIGMRAALGYAMRGDEGKDMLSAAITENLEFIDCCSEHQMPLIRPMLCLDSLYTLDDDDLMRIKSAVDPSVPIHITLSDGPDDAYHSMRCCSKTPAERICDLGLLSGGTLLAHCSRIKKAEADIIAESGASVVHTPMSDMLKADAEPDMMMLLDRGVCVGMGTDCITNDVLGLPRAALMFADKSAEPLARYEDVVTDMLINGNRRIATSIFGREIGILKPGAAADIIVMNYEPYTVFDEKTAPRHMLYGMNGGQCTHAMINGEFVILDWKLVPSKKNFLFDRLIACSEKLWKS